MSKSGKGVMIMETLAERMDAIFTQLKEDQAQMEDRILKSVHDQIRVTLATVPINAIKELQERVEYLAAKIDQKAGSSASTPQYGSNEGFGMPPPIRTQETQRYLVQGSKIDLPVFYGEEPDEWVAQCEYLFELYNISDLHRSIQAAAYFKGEAGSWYRGYRATNGHPSWPELVELLKIRFSKGEGISSYEQMKMLVQQGSVREYMKQFEIIKARSQVEFPYLAENHYVTAFISGLREDIKHLVISQQFHRLLDVF
jgi:Retrotransposon gag protein